MTEKRNILIYSSKVARHSETFIYFPALALKRYRPHFVGSLYRDAFNLPTEQVHIANGSGRFALLRQGLSLRIFGHNGVLFLKNKLRRLNPALIQTHFGPEAINVLPLAKALSIPMIIYYHGFDATFTREYGMQNRFLRMYLDKLPELQNHATLVLAQSNFLRDQVIDLGYDPQKVRTQYIGVNPPTEQPIPHADRKLTVLFVARLVEKKGTIYLIKAMEHVQQRYPDLELVIIGEGLDRDYLESEAEKRLRNYRFLGWQSPDQVAEAMKRALIFSVPSITAESGDSEGFGMVFIEAQRFGTPVVSTLHGGIVESVKDGKTGILVPEKDSTQLANAVIRLYEDKELWQQLSDAAYRRVRDEFNIHSLVSDLEEIYDEISSS